MRRAGGAGRASASASPAQEPRRRTRWGGPAGSEQGKGWCPAVDRLRCRPSSEAALDGTKFISRRRETGSQKATHATVRPLAQTLVPGSGTEIAPLGERRKAVKVQLGRGRI